MTELQIEDIIQMGILGLFREWQKSGLTSVRPRSRKSVIRTEVLEFRRMLSPMLTGTTLQVDGTGAADVISVLQDSNGVKVTINNVETSYGSSTQIDAINISSLGGDDQITIASIFSTTQVSVDGGTGNNTLISDVQANTWSITGPNSGTLTRDNVANVSFSNIQNLTGGSFDDNFNFYASGYVEGIIDGGNGINTLDYSNLNSGATVNLANSTATNIGGGFVNISITDFHGSQDFTDTLIGLNSSNTWNIDGVNSGNINNQFYFTGVENLVGGSGDDSFVFSDGGVVQGNITGGLGANTLDYSNRTDAIQINRLLNSSTAIGGSFDQINQVIGGSNSSNTFIGDDYSNTWNLNDPSGNAGTVVSTLTTIQFQGFQNLYGGASTDIFKFSDGAFVSGVISGGAGTNTIDYSARTDTVDVNLQTQTATGVGASFTGFQTFIGNLGASSSITGANVANTWDITKGNEGTVGAVGFKGFMNVRGGTGNDTYVIGATGFLSGTVTDTTGTNTLNYSLREMGIVANLQTKKITAVGGGFTGINVIVGSVLGTDQLTGADLDNVWTISGSDAGNVTNSAGTVSFIGIENLVGGTQADVFKLGNASAVTGVVKGGGGTNTLDYGTRTTGVVIDRQASSATAIGGGFVAIQQVIGSSSAADYLFGSNINNLWTINGPNAGNINGSFFYSGIENLVGGTLDDKFTIMAPGVGVPGAFQSGTIDGQGGNNTLDYSQRGVGVLVNLQTSLATAVGGGIASIQNLVGSSTPDDLLIGKNTASTWNITSGDSGKVNGLNFTGFETLTGGTSTDNFVFGAVGFVRGSVNGGAGVNTLDYSNRTSGVVTNLQTNSSTAIGKAFSGVSVLIGATAASKDNVLTGNDYNNNWNITGANTGTVTNPYTTTTFTNYGTLNGGALNDNFKFQNAGSIQGSLTGRSGVNVIDYSARTDQVSLNLQANTASAVGGVASSIQGLVGTASFNTTLVGSNMTNTWSVTGKNTGTLNSNFSFTNVGNLVGGTGVDIFSLASAGSITGQVKGGPSLNGDWIDYSSRATAVNANLTTGVVDGINTIVNIQNVHGGSGANTLVGGSAGSVLVGGDAADTLTAGIGRSLLIGGRGSDVLHGGAAQDIVISSNTDFDSNLLALNSILAEWQSSSSIATRVTNLRNGGGLNGSIRLIADVTVHNDVVPDAIYGGAGPNWLWGQPAEFKDRTASDYTDVPINNAPVLSGGTDVVFTINRGAIAVDPSIVVTDLDNLTLKSATVKITKNYVASEDTLNFSASIDTGNITGSFNATTGVLTLISADGTATVGQFQAALRSVTYSNVKASPSTLARSIETQAYDGIAYSITMINSITFNHAPTLSGTSTLTYTTNQGAAVINSVITVNDIDTPNRLAFATVRLTTNFIVAQDGLSFVSNPATTGDIVGSYNATTGVLTLTSAGSLPATVAQYQAALRQVFYTNSSKAPFKQPRAVVFQVSDGNALSDPLTSAIQFN
ncbi:beta strand repeat-containing protein [Schlesneria paludicola]|uniref:beta strand repeat-containing protein n=1 Tax=Schlesneria paludicola TaxID=360056 RepID=UPI00029AF154|nr:hypothetical protein [Schlesneria paludicola]